MAPSNPSAERLFQDLERAIHEHRLPPGAKLGEDELGEIYGVSRTLVRAALQSLAHRKLVELKRNRGAFVAQPSVREAQEVFEARRLLEPRTARVAADRMTPMHLAELTRHMDEEHAAVAAGETGRALFLSGEFHIEIARIADQETIAQFITQLISRSSLIIALYWQRRGALCDSQAHHVLMDAFAKGDGPRAEIAMTEHLDELLHSLDLSSQSSQPRSLKDALRPL